MKILLLFKIMFYLFKNSAHYLPIKTVAEYAFCPRAAIYSYLNWENDVMNVFLYQGELYHKRSEKQKLKHRKNKKQKKKFFVFSKTIKVYGLCDIIETSFNKIYPVEYKSGRPVLYYYKKIQLALQSICLSEMFQQNVNEGIIFFYALQKRYRVNIDENLKKDALNILREFRNIIKNLNHINLKEIPSCGRKGCSYYSVDYLPQVISH
jgi:CRISPR-associated exonuclease Cas4